MCSTRTHTTPARTSRRDEAGSHLRVADADREETVELLRRHGGEGRLTSDELEDRIGRAFAARTFGELAALTEDLPHPRRTPEARRARARACFGEHLRTYLAVCGLLVAIWALTGAGYFWPIWPILGWGLGIVMHRGSVPRAPRHGPAVLRG